MVFCLMISWMSSWKSENILQFNTSWLVSLQLWYYFRLCFSFSFSGYDLTLIKKSHILNCYLFLQKFLFKTKTYKLVVGKYRKSYQCFLTCVLFNKVSLVIHMGKFYVLQFYIEKKFVFAPRNSGGGWANYIST